MSLSIAHLASEMVPFSKTGGLADVVGALPPALAALGHDVRVVIPAHRRSLDDAPPGSRTGSLEILGVKVEIRSTDHQGVEVLLLDAPQLFVRPAPYGTPDGDYPDNPIRFAVFARAALEALAGGAPVDVLHAHDWQAALAPLLLRGQIVRPGGPRATVLTIHNLAYQGLFDPWVMDACALPRELFSVRNLEYYGRVNLLKGGITGADAVTTVSPTYAAEILTPRFGCGLEGVLAERRASLHGILNGLDMQVWDPASDVHLPRPYTASDVGRGKAAAKEALAQRAELDGTDRPLAGMVSRLAEQKGIDVVASAIDPLVALGFDVVILGSGERRWEELLLASEQAHAGRVRLFTGFDDPLAHLIYAASDVFLMPSRYEPCGLGQMIAMRYGALPVVTRTGGLADTVTDVLDANGTGFVVDPPGPGVLVSTMARAAELLGRPQRLARTRRIAMARDFSWGGAAKRYVDLYEALLSRTSQHEAPPPRR